MRLYIIFILDTAFAWQAFLSPEQLKKTGILPWIGVLKVRLGKTVLLALFMVLPFGLLQSVTSFYDDEDNTEFATGLTLISECHALANSNDISKLDKETISISTKAVFFKHNIPRYCDVLDYHLHPEFNNDTLTNTLAILTLNCEGQNLTSINWPARSLRNQKKTNSGDWKNIYAVGLSDRNYDFEQIIFRMKFVNSSKCSDFYVKDGINFKFLWPKYSICFKAVDVKRRCAFDSGMALASVHNGNWTLIGISVLGPGCILPSRYIAVFPYITWMSEEKKKHILNYRRMLNDDSREDKNTLRLRITAINPAKDIVQDKGFIEDLFYIKKLSHSSMVLRPSNANRKEVLYGCRKTDGVVMYRDAGLVRTGKISATGIYALSLYDLYFRETTCVMVNVVCTQRSKTNFWFDTGFKAESWDDLIKVIPHIKRGQTVPPKILFLRDSYYYYQLMRTMNLVFKFEFTGEAAISVDFYGILATSTPTTTTTTTTRRPRRTHPYHIHYTPGYQYEKYVKEGPPNYQL